MRQAGAPCAVSIRISDWPRFSIDLTIPNGLAWSPDGTTMYFAESMSRVVTAYDFDVATGSIAGGRPFVRIGPAVGLPANAVPDGLAVDTDGFLWVAVWNGHCVVRVSPDGVIVARVDLPVGQVSSVAFGGPELTDLYITSAREDFDARPRHESRSPGACSTFEVPFRGLPPNATRAEEGRGRSADPGRGRARTAESGGRAASATLDCAAVDPGASWRPVRPTVPMPRLRDCGGAAAGRTTMTQSQRAGRPAATPRRKPS